MLGAWLHIACCRRLPELLTHTHPPSLHSLFLSRYYNNVLFYNVANDFVQTGDPTGTGEGGQSVWGYAVGRNDMVVFIGSPHRKPPEPLPCSHIHGDKKRFFADEIFPNLKHTKAGTVAFARAGGVEDTNGSQARANPVLTHTSTVWLADTLSCLDSAVLLHSATQPRAP